MDVMPRASPAPASSLNPNAPPFVPLAYRSVEDFSDQWWALIQSSPWFRDYWLQERFSDPQEDSFFSNPDDLLLPDLDSLFDLMPEEEENFEEEEEEEPGYCRDLARTGGLKWRKERAEKPRYAEKVPKIVNVRVTPKTIQQPR